MSNIIEITDFSDPQLDIYARLNENQLAHLYEPNGGIFIVESPNVVERALNAGYEPISFLLEKKHIDGQAKKVLDRNPEVPVFTADPDVLTKLTGFALTRGVLCALRRRTLPSVQEICKGARRIAILENVMNPTNIGAIFRSAAALNIDAVLLTPACSDPLYRRASRVSMGTVFQIPWTYVDQQTCPKQQTYFPTVGLHSVAGTGWPQSGAAAGVGRTQLDAAASAGWPQPGLLLLRELGFKTAALALSDDSVSIDDPALMAEEKLAIILGTEGDGLAASTIADCDYTVKIPMSHGVDSLNVAAASAVAFWQLGRR